MSDPRIRTVERLQALSARALLRLPSRVQLRLSGRPAVVVDGQTLDPQLQLILSIRRRRHTFGLCEPTLEAARARFRREALVFRGPRTRVGRVRDFEIPADGRALRVRSYAPPDGKTQTRSLLVFLHGGGFVLGDLDTDDEACRLLCLHARTHVVSVDYRLAPEHPFPAALEDTLAALRWAQGNAARFGVAPERVALGGESAGANLAAVASLLSARDGHPPAAQLLVYPPADAVSERPSHELFGEGLFLTRADREEFSRHYTEGAGVDAHDPRVSPLLAPSLEGLPPALVVTAGFDLLRDEGEAYAERLRAAGNAVRARRFPTLAHGFVNMTGVAPSARAALVRTARDWRSLLDAER